MDKALFKVFLRDAGIPTPEHRGRPPPSGRADPEAVRARVAASVGYPAFCKPARLGSSVGISPVPDPDALDASLELAFAHDPKALVERAIVRARGGGGGAGRRRAARLAGGRDDLRGRLVRLRHQVRAGPLAARGPGRPARPRSPSAPASWPCAPSRPWSARAWRGSTSSSTDDGEVLLSELNTMPGFTPTSVYARLMGADHLGERRCAHRRY